MKNTKGLELAKASKAPLNQAEASNFTLNKLILKDQQVSLTAQKALKFIKLDENNQPITPSWWTVFANWKTLLDIILEILRIVLV